MPYRKIKKAYATAIRMDADPHPDFERPRYSR